MTSRSSLAMAGAIAATAILAACSGTPAPGASPGGPSAGVAPSQSVAGAAGANPPGDIPDNQAFVAFSPAGGGYSVKVPEGWSRASTGGTTSFTDKLNKVEVAAVAAPTQPTVASVSSTDVSSLKATVAKFAMGKVSVVARGGGSAILVTYQGGSAPAPLTGNIAGAALEA